MIVRPEPVEPTAFAAATFTFRDLIEVDPISHPSLTMGTIRRSIVRFAIVGTRVDVVFDDAAAASKLSAHYDVCDDDGVAAAIRLVVTGAAAGVRFDGGSRAWLWPYGPLPPESVCLLADVAARVLAFADRDLLALHAASLVGPLGALALCAPSGTGKSTTALAALELGAGVLSDEHCVVDREARVYPLERSMSLRHGGLLALAAETGRRARFDGPVLVRSAGIGRGAFGPDAAILRHVVLLERDGGTEPALEPAEPAATLEPLLDGVMCRERGLDRVARVLRLVRRCSTWRLRAGAPIATARKLAELLGVAA